MSQGAYDKACYSNEGVVMRKYFAAFVVFALCSAPLGAELKVTSKMSAKPVAGAAAANDMMSAMMGPMLAQMFGGAEGIEMTATIHEDGRMRADYPNGFAGMPAGAVVITRTDGTSVGYDAAAKTWWKMLDPSSQPGMAEMLAQMKPEVSTKRTGEFATVAGLKAERVMMTMRMAIPMPPGAENLPAEVLAMIPKEITGDSDTWVAPVHAKYVKSMAKAFSVGPMAGMGLEKMLGDLQGFTVRQVTRLSVLAGYELETLVMKIVEEDVADTVFDVPTGFKEIPMPMPAIK